MAPVLHGTPSWVAQLSPDLERSRCFYASLFGWQFINVAPPDASPFLIAHLDGHRVASLTAPQGPATWIVAVAVDALRDARTNAVAAGGSAPGESVQIPTLGRFHRLHDPLGTEIHIAEPDPGPLLSPPQRAGAWVESALRVHDVAAVAGFYEAVFGWQVADEHLAAPLPSGAFPLWVPCFSVADLDVAADIVRSEGGSVDAGAIAADVGSTLDVTDPFGAGFRIIQRPDGPPQDPACPTFNAAAPTGTRDPVGNQLDRAVPRNTRRARPARRVPGEVDCGPTDDCSTRPESATP